MEQAAPGGLLDLLPHRRAVSVFAQSRGRSEQQIFELAKHDYYHIVILIAVRVKRSNDGSVFRLLVPIIATCGTKK